MPPSASGPAAGPTMSYTSAEMSLRMNSSPGSRSAPATKMSCVPRLFCDDRNESTSASFTSLYGMPSSQITTTSIPMAACSLKNLLTSGLGSEYMMEFGGRSL